MNPLKIHSKIIQAKVNIHYLDSKEDANLSLVPLLVCPGLSETAEEYEELLQEIWPRRGIVLSFRGRGLSESPIVGYDLVDHIEDIINVVQHAGLTHFHIYAYSRGVSYALGYIMNYPDYIHKVILQDYPPEHKDMGYNWVDDYYNNYIIPFKRTRNITREAVNGIGTESTSFKFTNYIDKEALIIRGTQEGTLIEPSHMEHYRTIFNHIDEVQFIHSGHDIRNSEKLKLYETIRRFLDI
ncbi:MAG: alpha/beta hydrolase [Candidatus Pristimantibacillus lignocellulolyticus]|uniref:Alpha/beta hydrolase n=1 Tax=Candidatus Pristimantibacillus lignocellulolyticus TaxID=2994561 RepID=A0A9J6ZCI9_9BACL|nr:MAG: alpha/beta hydrolase [Candidatus Pristimantibacillus lignocellulolyticus]